MKVKEATQKKIAWILVLLAFHFEILLQIIQKRPHGFNEYGLLFANIIGVFIGCFSIPFLISLVMKITNKKWMDSKILAFVAFIIYVISKFGNM